MTDEPEQARQTSDPANPDEVPGRASDTASAHDPGLAGSAPGSAGSATSEALSDDVGALDVETQQALRDIADVPAVEVITTVALHLMSAAAVKCGLGEPAEADDEGSQAGTEKDLAEARILITALAGLVQASAPDLGTFHAGPLRDGLKSLQAAFREASPFPDPPGQGPGENLSRSRRT